MADNKTDNGTTNGAPQGTDQSPIQKFQTRIVGFWEGQPTILKASLAVIAILMIAAGVMLTTAERTSMRTLYSNLTPEDTSAILEFLKGKQVEYQLQESDSAVLVPAPQVHELRLELASEGLPQGGSVGFELFDQQKFGMTEFEERVAMRRALEGELSRTIARIKTVKNAKANLVLPKRSLLGRSQSKAQASIVLELHRGREISSETINAIVHLVSSSVQGLNPDDVTLVDTNGKLLSARSKVGSVAGEGHQYQKNYEKDLETSIQQMLDQLLGPSSSLTRVSAHFDFSQTKMHEEKYDPRKTAVRSERRETEMSGSQSNGGQGIPGTTSNLPGGETPTGNNAQNSSRKELETRNWEIDKTIKETVGSGSTLKRISVAVLVNGKNKDGQKFKARSASELKTIQKAVEGAIGYDKVRGDVVTVQSISFHTPEPLSEEALKEPFPWKEYLPLAMGALAVLFAFMGLLIFRKKKSPAAVKEHTLALPRPVHELEAMVEQSPNRSLPGEVSPEMAALIPDLASLNTPPELEAYASKTAELMSDVKGIFEDDPETSARILSQWLHNHANEESKATQQEEAV